MAGVPIGLFGASTGAAAALMTAAAAPELIGAVVSRGGRPDLAGGDWSGRARDAALDLREVRCEDHVRAAFPHVEVVFHRARRLAEVRTSDYFEDSFAVGGNLPGHRAEFANTSADTAVDGDSAALLKSDQTAVNRGGAN